MIAFYWSIQFLPENAVYLEWLAIAMIVVIFGVTMLILSNVTDGFSKNIAFRQMQDSGFLCGTAFLTRRSLNAFADKMEEILEDVDEQERLKMMEMLIFEAEQCNLLNPVASSLIRTESTSVFVRDLLRDNHDAYEWMSNMSMHDQQVNPKTIWDESDLVAAICRLGARI